jgi:DNA-binding NtrC family response regulator
MGERHNSSNSLLDGRGVGVEGMIYAYDTDHFKILVVDDDDTILKLIQRFLGDQGYQVDTTLSGKRAVEKERESRYDLVILDLVLPDMNGLEVLKTLKKEDSSVSVLIMTGHGKIETAVQAMKLGADDYLQKPFKSLDVLLMAIKRIKEYRDLRAECTYLKEQLNETYSLNNIIGRSRKITDIFQLIRKVAPLNSTVLIEGESGTGKELIARAIHQYSERKESRFVAINCGAIPVTLLESELFGYERGAFTGAVQEKKGYFEAADAGTIFLDEISEMDLALQVKLLRVIQEKKFQRIGGTREIATDVRIIASTNRNLDQEVLQNRFRKDLYYRINVIKITVPPLRERQEDIPLLSYYFVKKYNEEFGRNIRSISSKVINAFLNHRWDGNVRELENVVEHAVAMTESEEIYPHDLPKNVFSLDTERETHSPLLHFDEAKRQFEKQYLEGILEMTKGNVTEASRVSSIPRQNIYEKIRKLKIDPNRFR